MSLRSSVLAAAMPDRPTAKEERALCQALGYTGHRRLTTWVRDRVQSSSLPYQECRIRTAASAQPANALVERVGHHGDDRVHAGSDFSGELDPQTGDVPHPALWTMGWLTRRA